MRIRLIFVFAVLCNLGVGAIAQQSLNGQITLLIDRIKESAELKLDSMTPEAAIKTEAFELQRLSNPALVASVSAEGATALAEAQIEKSKSGFSNLRLTFAKQTVEATIAYKGTLAIPALAALDANAQLRATLTPAIELVSDQGTAQFKIRFAVGSLDITSLALSRNGQPLSAFEADLAEGLAKTLLLPAQRLLNHIETRVPVAVATKVAFRETSTNGVSISFDPKSVSLGLDIAAAAFLVDQGRLTILAQDLPSSNAIQAKSSNSSFETFRDAFLQAVRQTGASGVNGGQFSAFVKTDLVQRLVAKLAAAGPICMNAKATDISAPIHIKLSLPPETAIDCTPERDCTPTKNCEQGEDCAQRAACGDVCTFRAFGHCVTHGHDLGCEAGKTLRKATCEADKVRRKGQCEAEKATSKASCEALKSSEKGLCEGLKQAYKSLRGTGPDYANVDSDDLHVGGTAHICLSALKLEGPAFHLTGKLQAEGTFAANGNIQFMPLNILGHLLCFDKFNYNLAQNVHMPPQAFDADSRAQIRDDGKALTLTASIANAAHLQFPLKNIASNLAADPKFQLTCPIPGVATKLRILTPDQWWPAAARGELDKRFPDLNLGIDLFARPPQIDGVAFTGALQNTEAGVGGVFTIASGKASP